MSKTKLYDWFVLIVNVAILAGLVLWNCKRLRTILISFSPAISHQYPQERRY
jgi:hypothetical protein